MLDKALIAKYVPLNLIHDGLLSDVVAAAKVFKAQKGTLLFKRGKVLEQYYFLLQGEVDLINSDFGVDRVSASSERSYQSLNSHSPTTVSAIAKSQVIYFTLPRQFVEKWLAGVRRIDASEPTDLDAYAANVSMEVGDVQESDDWMSRILTSPVFARIPMTRLQELFSRFEPVPVSKGERVIREGGAGDYFYVIASGQAIVSSRVGNFEVYLKEGDYFGEESLISQSPRNADVTMLTDGVLKRLNAEDFSALIKGPVLRYLTADEISKMKKPYKILDVRLPIEYRSGHSSESINIPLSRLRENVKDLAFGCLYAVSDEAGVRADIAAYLLCQAGFEAVVLSVKEQTTNEAASKVS